MTPPDVVPADFGPPVDPELYIPEALCAEVRACLDGLVRMLKSAEPGLLDRAMRARRAVYDLVEEAGMNDLNAGGWLERCNRAAGIDLLEDLGAILVQAGGALFDPYQESDLRSFAPT